jgi:hypothetical protein
MQERGATGPMPEQRGRGLYDRAAPGRPRTTDSTIVERLVRNTECAGMEHVARWAVSDLDEAFLRRAPPVRPEEEEDWRG